MAEKLSWNFAVQALNGPCVSGQGDLTVEVYEKIKVTVPADGEPYTVQFAPSKATCSLLVIKADHYSDPDSAAKQIRCSGSQEIPLHGPLVLIGKGAASLLYGKALEQAPTEPAPTEPAPTEPAPTETAPTETAPTETAPTEPAPTETTPAETLSFVNDSDVAVVIEILAGRNAIAP